MAESEEKMYHSRKSDVLDCLQKEIEARLSSIDIQESPPHFDSVVIDVVHLFIHWFQELEP